MARRYSATLRALSDIVLDTKLALLGKRRAAAVQRAIHLRDELLAAVATLDDLLGDSPRAPAIFWHGGRSYSADGKNPIQVSRREDEVLQWFVGDTEASDTRLLRHSVSNVAEVMAKLKRKFGDAVQLPTRHGKGRGYYVRVRDALLL